jgi:plasmid stabilization system protein ParE
MKRKLVWTDEALRNLQDIMSNELWSVEARGTVVDHIISRIESVIQYPFSAPQLPERDDQDLRSLFVKPFRIAYKITEKEVVVLTVFHYRRLYPDDTLSSQ